MRQKGAKMAKISVIIPIHHTAAEVRSCLNIVLRQTLQDLEIVCVNDGSPAETRAVLTAAAAADERILVINQPHRGRYAAINAGLEECSGEYVAFFLPGAEITADFLEKLYHEAKSWRVDIAGSGIRERTLSGAKEYMPAIELQKLKSLKQKAKIFGFPHNNTIGNKIYRRRALVEKGLFFKENTMFAEMFWTPLVHKQLGAAVSVPQIWYLPPPENNAVFTKSEQQNAVRDYELARLYVRSFAEANRLVQRRGFVSRQNICFLGLPFLDVLQSRRCGKCYMFHLKVLEYQRRNAA